MGLGSGLFNIASQCPEASISLGVFLEMFLSALPCRTDQEQPDVSQPTINSARVQELKVGMSTVFNVSINVVSSPTFYSWEKNGVTVAENNVSRSLGTILTLTFSLQVTSQADAGIYTATVFGNKTAVMGAIDVVSTCILSALMLQYSVVLVWLAQ